jgi:flagellar assembly protein FliH
VVGDASLLRGGCRIETFAGEIDATLQTRWQKLSAALAQDHEWVA